MAPPQVQGGRDRLNYIFTESGISIFSRKILALPLFLGDSTFIADETK